MAKDIRYRKHRYTADNKSYRWVWSFSQKCWVLQQPKGYIKKVVAKFRLVISYKEPRTPEEVKDSALRRAQGIFAYSVSETATSPDRTVHPRQKWLK